MIPGKHVLYFALQPPPQVQAQALALAGAARAKHRLAAKPLPASRLHVSLNYVGDFRRPPGPVIDKALEAVENVAARRFLVEFNRLGTWRAGNPAPVVLWGDEGVIGVSALYSAIHKALAKAGMVPRREAEIAPHMSLIYDKAQVPETFVEPLGWRVEEFVLIHAIHAEGLHDVAGRFPLSG